MRKAYLKPRLYSQECFETSALGCGKTSNFTASIHLTESMFLTGQTQGGATFTPDNPYHVPPGINSLQDPVLGCLLTTLYSS